MSIEKLYETWRQERSRREPSDGFSDRVMQQIDSLPMPASVERPAVPNQIRRLVRIGLCAAAVVAALFRVAELLSMFVATGTEN